MSEIDLKTAAIPAPVILSDFDGTISPVDLSDFLYRKFAACGKLFADQWAQGLIDTREEIQRTFETVSAGRAEIEAALKGVPIDETFHELVEFARQNNIELAVVSDGLDWAISTVLGAHDIHDLAIYANHVIFNEGKLTFEFPWYNPMTPLAGVCKPLIVQRYHEKGLKVVFIGDGRSDQDAVRSADLVFAKGALAEFCRAQNIAAWPYQNFSQVCAQIRLEMDRLP
jgi:2-hydroxy-3-keto-5-methylthiopentenyl-1-phosphate phosphatase